MDIYKISEIEHIESLRKGHLHLKPIQYHINNAKIYPKQNNGDSYECLLTKGQGKILCNGIVVGEVNIHHANVLVDCPVFCALTPNYTETVQGKFIYKPNERLRNDFMSDKSKTYTVLKIQKDEFIKNVQCIFL